MIRLPKTDYSKVYLGGRKIFKDGESDDSDNEGIREVHGRPVCVADATGEQTGVGERSSACTNDCKGDETLECLEDVAEQVRTVAQI